MSKGREHQDVCCPFFKHFTELGVVCDGLTEHSCIEQRFRTKDYRKRYLSRFCNAAKSFSDCPIAEIHCKSFDEKSDSVDVRICKRKTGCVIALEPERFFPFTLGKKRELTLPCVRVYDSLAQMCSDGDVAFEIEFICGIKHCARLFCTVQKGYASEGQCVTGAEYWILKKVKAYEED